MLDRKLYRSQDNRMLGGIAGGIAEYLDADPTVVRLAWVVLSVLTAGSGVIIYFLAWLIIPEREDGFVPSRHKPDSDAVGGEFEVPQITEEPEIDPEIERARRHRNAEFVERRRRMAGIALIVFGGLFFLREVAPRWIHGEFIWALGLIAVGVLILRKRD